MRRALVVTVAALAACGVRLGSAPRRIFPNPTSSGDLEAVPLEQGIQRSAPNCRLAGGGNASVEYAAVAPWGVVFAGGELQGTVPPIDAVIADTLTRIRAALGTCPAGTGSTFRVVVDGVELNMYDEMNGYDAARVVLRLERFDRAFTTLRSRRVVGVIRTKHQALDAPGLIRLAADDALAGLLASWPESP